MAYYPSRKLFCEHASRIKRGLHGSAVCEGCRGELDAFRAARANTASILTYCRVLDNRSTERSFYCIDPDFPHRRVEASRRLICSILGLDPKHGFDSWLEGRLVPGMEFFDPRGPKTKEIEGVFGVNTYEAPSWRAADPSLFDGGCRALPEIYRAFFMHLTRGDSASFVYLLDWIAQSFAARLEEERKAEREACKAIVVQELDRLMLVEAKVMGNA